MVNKQSPDANKEIIASLGLEQINELLGNKKKLWWLNFQTGFVRGFAGVLGAAVIIVLIGFLVTVFGGLPYIGHILQQIGAATQAK
ncbi:MAG: DUF5665 domain-containing protein [Candidatus Saccharibacteria bacterium]